MAGNNLRIMYKNLADYNGTNVSANSTAGTSSVNFLKFDYKSLRWRSVSSTTTTSRAALLITVPSATTIAGVVFAFSNLSSSSRVRIRGFTGTAPTIGTVTDSNTAPTIGTIGSTLEYDTSPSGVASGTLAAPFQEQGNWIWGINTAVGINAYYNKYTYGRVWLSDAHSAIQCTSWVIEIEDTNSSDQYIEIGRLILGVEKWSPKYNTSYGVTSTPKDLSTNYRTEAGDLVTQEAPMYNTLSLELKYMDKADRSELLRIYRMLGTKRPLFISVFPDNSDDWGKEGTYQLFGKFTQLNGISHHTFEMYGTSLDIEEV